MTPLEIENTILHLKNENVQIRHRIDHLEYAFQHINKDLINMTAIAKRSRDI